MPPTSNSYAKTKMHTVMNTSWKDQKTTARKDAKEDGFNKARAWQSKAFKLLKDKTLAILNAPTGSGKSWEMCLLSAHKMETDVRLRTIIAVPQMIIGNGFLDAHLILPDNRKKIHWKPTHNLCEANPGSNVDYIIKFLKTKSTAKTPLNDRVLVTTHASLLAAYNRLHTNKQLRLLNDLVLWIDEAHHVKNVEMENFVDATLSNGIGMLVKHLAGARTKNVHLGLATASFFRGDQCTLITKEMATKFVRFDLPYDEYLLSMTHLKGFSFSYMLSGRDYMSAVKKIIHKKGDHKTIVNFPHPQTRHAKGDKHKDVEDLRNILSEKYGSKVRTTEDGVEVFQKGRKTFNLLNLVDEVERDPKKEFSQTINKDPKALDCVAAIGMFKEGADWKYADQSIIIGPRQSLVEMLQMIGRLFRDCEGKETVEVINILPWSFDQTDREKFREKLNNYLKGVYCLMILEDILMPLETLPPPDPNRPKVPPGTPGNGDTRLINIIKDPNVIEALMEESGNVMQQLADETDEKATHQDYVEVVKKMVESKGVCVKSKAGHVAKLLVCRHARETLSMRGINVKDINIQLIESVNPVRWMVDFTTHNNGPTTFRELRRAISASGKVFPSMEKAMELTDRFFKKSKLPRTVENYQKWARGEFAHIKEWQISA